MNATAARRPGRSDEKRDDGEHGRDERDGRGERVLGQRDAAARQEEGVVEGVGERDDGGGAEHDRLGGASADTGGGHDEKRAHHATPGPGRRLASQRRFRHRLRCGCP